MSWKPGVRRVVDGDLDAVEADVLAGPGRQRRGPDEDPAVALRADLEVEGQHEVLQGLLVDQHVVAGVGVQAAVLNVRLRATACSLGVIQPWVVLPSKSKSQPSCFSCSVRALLGGSSRPSHSSTSRDQATIMGSFVAIMA